MANQLIVRTMVRSLLKSLNPEIDQAEDGQEAVDKFKQSPEGYYSFILMDIRMQSLMAMRLRKEFEIWIGRIKIFRLLL